MGERRAWFALNSWAGLTHHECLVVGETPCRYRVRALPGATLSLAGRSRTICGEQTALVPKDVVRFAAEEGRSDG